MCKQCKGGAPTIYLAFQRLHKNTRPFDFLAKFFFKNQDAGDSHNYLIAILVLLMKKEKCLKSSGNTSYRTKGDNERFLNDSIDFKNR